MVEEMAKESADVPKSDAEVISSCTRSKAIEAKTVQTEPVTMSAEMSTFSSALKIKQKCSVSFSKEPDMVCEFEEYHKTELSEVLLLHKQDKFAYSNLMVMEDKDKANVHFDFHVRKNRTDWWNKWNSQQIKKQMGEITARRATIISDNIIRDIARPKSAKPQLISESRPKLCAVMSSWQRSD